EATTFIEPLSTGEAGSAGVSCAAAVLQMMAGHDITAPAALQTAIRWLTDGEIPQRLAAGEAFIGELGRRYQEEAALRLWQLITQDNKLSTIALETPALFFANLVDSGDDARDLMKMIIEKLDRFGRPGTALTVVDTALTMSLNLLSIDSNRGGRAAFELIA